MHDDKFTKGMRGEFRGDFTRDTFDPLRHFSRVLMQQGRVQLDADWNEQVSSLLYYLRRLGADLMGPHGAPRTVDGNIGKGFQISANGPTFEIGYGHYYVNGILCENDDKDLSFIPDEPLTTGDYLVYLDVWERHVSYVEDDYIREKALGGPDTATRAKIVWQVKVIDHIEFEGDDDIDPNDFKSDYDMFRRALTISKEKKPGSGQLKARARKTAEENKNPCLTSPESSYRGAENQLYRVEIHNDGTITDNNSGPTFKWSRENGSVIFPITAFGGEKVITLEHLGRDSRFGLKPNDWVEIVDDDYILRNRAEALLQIEEIDPENLQVTLNNQPQSSVGTDEDKHPYLRRWDQTDGASNGVPVPVKEGDTESDWILLEDSVEIQFQSESACNSGDPVYKTGDYWLIPARTATGDVEWPCTIKGPIPLLPQGVEHHYAPLWNITVNANGNVSTPNNKDLRRKLKKNW